MSAPYYHDYPAGHTAVCMVFDSFAAATGASSATSSFANTDIQIYKDGGTTQRASAAGIVVSTSFDTNTGLQMVTIDLSDNTDAGFYAAGHEYSVAVADVTIDSQTVRFWLGSFSIERAGGVLALLKAGTAKVDVTKWLTGTIPAVNTTGVPLVDTKYVTGTLQTAADVGGIVTDTVADLDEIITQANLIPGTIDGKTFAAGWTLVMAALLGKASGMATATAIFRAVDDSKDRVTATVDANGNRTAVTLDAS